MPTTDPTTYRVYGTTVSSAYDLSSFLPRADRAAEPDVNFRCLDSPPPVLGQPEVVYDDGTITISRHSGVTVLRFGESSIHYVSDDGIECFLSEPEHEYLVPIQLLGMVIAVWLEKRGSIVLHASAADVDGKAVLFMAGGKSGKTSLVAQLTKSGGSLVTEDLARVVQRENVAAVAPGYPLLRMWPDVAAHFVGDATGLEVYHPAFDKLWVPADRLGTFASESVPLGVIYLPERKAEGSVEIQPVSDLTALRTMLAGSFLADMMEPAVDSGRRLESISRLVEGTRVRRLLYPDGLEKLQEVDEAIRADSRG